MAYAWLAIGVALLSGGPNGMICHMASNSLWANRLARVR
jgi:hypothetical protein